MTTATEAKVKTERWDQQPVPQERWGKDHWTTLLYLETCTVDRRGRVEHAKMRTSRRNWRLAGRVHGESNIMPPDKYPTRLLPTQGERATFDSVLLAGGHDDWECMQDMADAGLLTFEVEDERGSHVSYPLAVTVTLTDAGRNAAADARARRAETGRAAP